MKIKSRHALLIFSLMLSAMTSQSKPIKKDPPRHLYIEWQHWNNQITLGSFGKNNKEKIPFRQFTLSEIKETDIESWLGNEEDHALFLFHAMWGQQRNFHASFLSAMDETLQQNAVAIKQSIISFIWHAGGVFYRQNWQKAATKGQPLGQVAIWLARHYKNDADVLCHSMGSRFFQGILSGMDRKKYFRTITLFSPDLGDSSTEKGFMDCRNTSKKLFVYLHKKDRLLLASSIFHGNGRLGRNGPVPAIDQVHVIDMTNHASSLSNHSLYSKQWVRAQLSKQYSTL